MKLQFSLPIAFVTLIASAKAVQAAPITVSGVAYPYAETSYPTANDPYEHRSGTDGVGIAGRTITVRVQGYRRSTPGAAACDVCAKGFAKTYTTTTVTGEGAKGIPSGFYSQVIDPAAGETCSFAPYTKLYWNPTTSDWDELECPGDTKLFSLSVTTVGSEVRAPAQTTYTTYPSSIPNMNLRHVPHRSSPYGKYWARRVGNGRYPIVIIEGFDPNDDIKSGDLIHFLRASSVGSPKTPSFYWRDVPPTEENPVGGLWKYALDNDYTLWLFNSGTNGANSIAGAGGDDRNGLAYEAMRLVRDLVTTFHAGAKIVVGGYSMGGAVVQAGLKKWCAGSWSTLGLPADCSEVSLWFAGDSPLGDSTIGTSTGANIPVSLQRYVHDPAIAADMANAPSVKNRMDSPAAHELLKYAVNTATSCNVNCNDLGGCDSYEGDYTSGCQAVDTYRAQYLGWLGNGEVTRATGRVPAIAFSVGTPPAGVAGSKTNCPDPTWHPGWCTNNGYTSTCYPGYYSATPYFINHIYWAENHNLYANTAAGAALPKPLGECDPGSGLDKMKEAVASGTTDEWFFGSEYETSYATPYPTFVATETSLLWSKRDTLWRDYWWNVDNADHSPNLPAGAGNFLMAWVKEYLKGRSDKPYCGEPLAPGGKKYPTACRASFCGDRVCDANVETVSNCPSDCL